MKHLTPCQNLNEALDSLDNGGRFYNIFTTAQDGVISKAELSKVCGVINDRQQMILFLELTTSDLKKSEKEIIHSKLESGLQEIYEKYRSQRLSPSEVESQGKMASNIVVSGTPKLIDSRSRFNGFITIPVAAGSVTTVVMVPIIDQYDVYELRDEESSVHCLIAHQKSKSQKLPSKKITIGGVLKELSEDKSDDLPKQRFIEIAYYLD